MTSAPPQAPSPSASASVEAPKPAPPAPDALLDSALSDLCAWIRDGEVSPVDVVEAHIRQIEAVNPKINALIADRFEAAMGEARAAQEALAGGGAADVGPLHGVPCTIKEFFGVEGMPHTAGLYAWRDRKAQEDATAVRRLREAGAIVLGVSNTPEGGMWMETHHAAFGRTTNPWNTRHTSGGSSGGEGALVSAGASPLGLGSDIGGSIRIPAAFCGVVGHKPTHQLIPSTGHDPVPQGEALAFMTGGPLVRRVRDVMPVLRVLAGPDGRDPYTRAWTLGDPDAVDLSEVVVYPTPDHGPLRVRPVMRQAIARATHALKTRGAQERAWGDDPMRRSIPIWSAFMTEGSTQPYLELLGGGEPVRLGRELVKLAMRRSNHTPAGLFMGLIDALGHKIPVDPEPLIRQGRALRQRLIEALGPNGVMLHPPYTRPAPRHNTPLLTPFDPMCTAIFNVLQLPVTQVPLGFSPDGLPLGVQVIARPGNDHLTIAVAQAIEDAFGGWLRADPA